MKHILTRCALAALLVWAVGCNVCGNGKLQENKGEQCDDGNNDDGDGCSAQCLTEGGPGVCGDGVLNTGEQCDPPDNVTCDQACQTIIVPPNCGNGVIDAADGEQCDPPDGVTCNAGCQLIAVCGNGVQEAGEQCDDGNQIDTDTCHNNCTALNQCPDPNLGLEGAACATSDECCQFLGIGCLDTDGDGSGDTCGNVEASGQCPTCSNGTPCECCDGINNEDPLSVDNFDDLIDDADPQCLGPTDNDETNFSTGIPGDNNGANGATECPFDGNSGTGNDADCASAIPSGCDCLGCCQIDLNNNGTNDVFAVDANGNPVDVNLDGVNDGCAFVANTNCTVTPLDPNTPGGPGGPCNVDADCGQNPVDPSLQMTCEIDGDGVTKYCSTCVGSAFNFNQADCVNTCVCCEACAGVQTAECDPDPALAGVDVGVEGNDGDADTVNDCGGQAVCQSAVSCASDADCVVANGEVCDLVAGLCLLDTCSVNTDCVAPLICDTFQGGCCVFIP